MLENHPPAYKVLPLTARTFTPPLAPGFQVVALPVFASKAAIRARACPPMLSKRPAAYTLLPLNERE